jgi:hypothetical protein
MRSAFCGHVVVLRVAKVVCGPSLFEMRLFEMRSGDCLG